MKSLQESNNTTVNRRRRLQSMLLEYVREQAGSGGASKGFEQAFAALLQISPSMLSQIKSSRPIGDKLARQIEVNTGKPQGWLDEPLGQLVMADEAEDAFVDLARRAWRAANARKKRELARALSTMVGAGAQR